MGGKVTAKFLIRKVNPAYPEEARRDRIQGTVRLHVIIGRDGSVQQVELISGHPVLAKPAIDAVRQWVYRPTLLNGEPVEVDTTIDVVFSLTD
jgi:protein TonB